MAAMLRKNVEETARIRREGADVQKFMASMVLEDGDEQALAKRRRFEEAALLMPMLKKDMSTMTVEVWEDPADKLKRSIDRSASLSLERDEAEKARLAAEEKAKAAQERVKAMQREMERVTKHAEVQVENNKKDLESSGKREVSVS